MQIKQWLIYNTHTRVIAE